jgi:hypothetical protein
MAQTIIDLLKVFHDFSLPTILVLGGIIIILLSFVRKIIGKDDKGNIELEPNKGSLRLIGFILIFCGIGLYLIPVLRPSTETQKVDSTGTVESTKTPELIIITETPQQQSSVNKIAETEKPAASDQEVTSTPQPLKQSLPSGRTLASGESFTPPQGEWIWICSGDFVITKAGGEKVVLHDNSEFTGLIIVIASHNNFSIEAPTSGYCEPFWENQKDNAVSEKISLLQKNGCSKGCSSVNVKELNQDGDILVDYWKP